MNWVIAVGGASHQIIALLQEQNELLRKGQRSAQ
jgi:hypothetical protein